MKVKIYTSYNCIIKSELGEEFVELNENLTFQSLPNNLFVYPVDKASIFPFQIEISNRNSNFYRIVESENQILIFLIDSIVAKNSQIYSVTCENNNCQIEVQKNLLNFSCGKNKKSIDFPIDIVSSQCGNFYHIAYARLVTKENQYLVAYNTKTFNTKVFKGEKIQLLKEGFITTSSAYGYKEAIIEYAVSKEGLKMKDKKFIRLQSVTLEETLPYQFLNSVKIGDYEYALSLLSPQLKCSLSTQTLKEYFGTLTYIFPLAKTSCFAISNNKNIIYTFSIQNNKITEINDNID